MDVHTLISLFGERSGVPLALSDAGTLALQFADGVVLNLENAEQDGALHLYVVVGEDPHEDDARLLAYSAMLQANVFCHETAGGTLGLDDSTGDLMLTRRIDLAVADVEYLSEAIEMLVAAAGQWKTRLSAPMEAEDSVPMRAIEPSEQSQFSLRA
ncbi:type III secretion system chaperone [Achromobacter marplatensis]|uniref:type III secretion system chaperone n=1 Tax=Achromobacter marplatensis TaxID=470868 RepID=UPI0039F71858